MWVEFLEDRDVRDHLGRVVQSFRRGQVVELSEASARRWLRRHAAREFPGAPPVAARPPASPTDASGAVPFPAPGQTGAPPPALALGNTESHGQPRRPPRRTRSRRPAVDGAGPVDG